MIHCYLQGLEPRERYEAGSENWITFISEADVTLKAELHSGWLICLGRRSQDSLVQKAQFEVQRRCRHIIEIYF